MKKVQPLLYLVLMQMGADLMREGITNNVIHSTGRSRCRFSKRWAKDGEAGVELGKLALQKSSNEDVKEFANMVIRDHSNANRDLLSLGHIRNIEIPAGMPHEGTG